LKNPSLRQLIKSYNFSPTRLLAIFFGSVAILDVSVFYYLTRLLATFPPDPPFGDNLLLKTACFLSVSF
jgi:hypothetical protein